MSINHQWLLASRPSGEPRPENWRWAEVPVPGPDGLGEGQVLVRHHYLSLDPYMRMRMNEGKSYAAPQAIGEVMVGGTVGEVVVSRHPKYAAGDFVANGGGWQEYAVVDATQPGVMRKLPVGAVPLSAYLGAVGMPGVTAWLGLVKIIEPKAGETIVVSAASGAVGGVVGQLAKARGCRVVGFAGGADKCRYVVEELGFDACIDYKAHASEDSLAQALAAAAPQGVDGCFENVGGRVLDVTMAQMNAFGRIALCGLISGYNEGVAPLKHTRVLLTQRLKMQGFIVSEHMQVWPEALAELSQAVASGGLRYRESIAQGLASAPEAFIGLLRGRNFGKQLVKLV
jgi:NADPH-dependent curcumin reductase CurA